ncbi:hypothetical protein [Streptomyces graminofaciens]|uniref:hypothetical protein n=1 Tax=Streptomyces graminofaciens TaxID=68212 RepID=UPI0025727EAB|nr:hypothetical protein [Streptomyces graminofaciens]
MCGTGFTYRGAEQELIVVAHATARLRAGSDGVHSAAGADLSALNCSSAANNSPWSRCSAARNESGRPR